MEKVKTPILIITPEAAKERYQALLDLYGINNEIQELARNTISKRLKANPMKTIREIDGYWREAFESPTEPTETSPPSSSLEKRPPSVETRSHTDSLTGLPPVERIIYERQRNHWTRCRDAKRTGRRR